MTGIDVSHHQGAIHWDDIKDSDNPKIDFAFIKATQGQDYVDPMLKLNAFNAEQAGIRQSYYHFATLNSNNIIDDAVAEANFFISVIKKLPPPKLPLVLDIERNPAMLNKVDVLSWIINFFSKLKELGYEDHILYSGPSFLNENLPAGHNLGGTKLWIAVYRPAPALPRGWSEYYIWQHSAKGNVPGIKGDVDMNVTINPI